VGDSVSFSIPTAGKLNAKWDGKWVIKSIKSPVTAEFVMVDVLESYTLIAYDIVLFQANVKQLYPVTLSRQRIAQIGLHLQLTMSFYLHLTRK